MSLLKKLVACTALALAATAPAFAWKPVTHVYLAEEAWKDAKDGSITVNRVDYATGNVTGVVGTYKVDPKTLAALRDYHAQYRSGILGPDAYPDILTGQQAIHPNTAPWLNQLWKNGNSLEGRQRSFVIGYLTHAAGDMYGHTFINQFAGGPFALNPPTNAARHIVVEGYVNSKINPAALSGDFYDATINALDQFIYDNLIDARNATSVDRIFPENAEGATFSVPRIFSTLRDELTRQIDDYYREKNRLGKAAEDCAWHDTSCSATILRARQAALMASDGPKITYLEYWRDDIDEGLRKWPSVSLKIARAMFFNPTGKADINTAHQIASDFARDHLLSMSGAPDAVGATIRITGDIADAVTPDFILDEIKELKKELLKTIIEKATGISIDYYKNLLSDPATYFDQVLSVGGGENVTKVNFERNYLKMAPGEQYMDPYRIPATYNTILMSKLILLDRSEINRLIKDLGGSQTLGTENVMLFPMESIDKSNQWCHDMAIEMNSSVYKQIFMQQPGEDVGCKNSANDSMSGNQTLTAGQSITSQNGKYQLIFQDDGNLVIYRLANGKKTYRWDSKTNNKKAKRAVMQSDGNFVIYNENNQPVWASNTHNKGAKTLVMQNDGNLVIYKGPGNSGPVWATNTDE